MESIQWVLYDKFEYSHMSRGITLRQKQAIPYFIEKSSKFIY